MTEMPLRTRRRPPVYRPKGRVAFIIGLGAVGYFSDGWWWAPFAAVILLYLAVTWLLAPYSRFAWRVHQPPLERIERWRSLAEKLSNAPVIGPVFRFGRKYSDGAVTKVSDDYESWLRRQSHHLRTLNPKRLPVGCHARLGPPAGDASPRFRDVPIRGGSTGNLHAAASRTAPTMQATTPMRTACGP
jgi:hypothetical protein